MDSSENVATELKEIFQSILNGYASYTFSMMITNKGIEEISQRLYKTLLNWITDSDQTPKSIIHMLDTYLPGLDGFSTKKGSQNLVAFFCLRALAQRRPVLEGSWEDVIYIIKEYSNDFALTPGKSLINAKKEGEKWLEDVQKLCSPNQCPNPCLGLEIIRLTSLFRPVFGKFNYDKNSIRELVLNTICHVQDTKHQILNPYHLNMSIYDLKKIMDDNSIDIESIMQRDHPKSRQFGIIRAVVEITKIFVYSEPYSESEYSEYLSLYFHFGGLICSGIDEKLHVQLFLKAVYDRPSLQHYVIDTYNAIKYAFDYEEYRDEIGSPNYYAIEFRDMILHMFFKHYVRLFPRQQSLREVNGGISPAAQYRLRYFSDNHRSLDCKVYKNYEDSTSEESDDSEYYY